MKYVNISLNESSSILIFSEDQPNTYNILKVAGSPLGNNHTEEAKAKISKSKTGENDVW